MEYNGHKYVGFQKTGTTGGSNSGEKDPAYCYGTWKGREIRFKKMFRGHEFTDEECDQLLAGADIEVTGLVAKSCKVYGVHGKLAELEYNGHKYIGFNNEGFINNK